jgi:hypothetical protein
MGGERQCQAVELSRPLRSVGVGPAGSGAPQRSEVAGGPCGALVAAPPPSRPQLAQQLVEALAVALHLTAGSARELGERAGAVEDRAAAVVA